MKKIIPALLLFINTGFNSIGQDLTGTWMGVGSNDKIVIVQIGDSCYGYTYDEGMGYCKANFKGSYNEATKKLKGVNPSFIEHTPTHTLSSYKLTYFQYNGAEYLDGTAGSKGVAGKIASLGFSVPLRYRKISAVPDETTAYMVKMIPQPVKPSDSIAVLKTIPAPEVQPLPEPKPQPTTPQILTTQKNSRSSKIVQTIITNADSIRLVLFDNGEIDNDTVTVFANGKIIIDRLGLSTKMNEYTIPFDEQDSILTIELMANNLGSIPPNTANLFLYAGKEKYELKTSADFSQNAAIEIRRLPRN